MTFYSSNSHGQTNFLAELKSKQTTDLCSVYLRKWKWQRIDE